MTSTASKSYLNINKYIIRFKSKKIYTNIITYNKSGHLS